MRAFHLTCLGLGSLCAGVAVWLAVTPSQALLPPPEPSGESRCQDGDKDGFGLGCAKGPDCNDSDPTINPAQSEVCNLRDDNCDGLVDNLASCNLPPVRSGTVRIPAGSFLQGSSQGAPDERPEHTLQISAFRLDRNEVTNQQYQLCVDRGQCSLPQLLSSRLRKEYYGNPQFADYPVIFVSWPQADAYCRAAGGRLPTEAEWEKAARGSEIAPRAFPWGEAPADCTRANLGGPGSCVGDTDRVGLRPEGASPYGAFDMAGNVWEWVADWYDAKYYEASPPKDPTGPETGTLRVMRGGCWISGASSLRVSCRKAELPSTWAYNVGFRCAYPEGR